MSLPSKKDMLTYMHVTTCRYHMLRDVLGGCRQAHEARCLWVLDDLCCSRSIERQLGCITILMQPQWIIHELAFADGFALG